jgi:hypothetical protein
LTSLRKIKTILSVVLAASLLGGAAFAQSQRRSAVKIGAPRQAGKPVKVKQYEIDQRCGRVAWVEGDKVGVIMQSYNVYMDWNNFYYACDARLNPVAALLNIGISHRNCRIFLIGDGSVEAGDWVFIKQIPPRAGSEEEEEVPEEG